MTSGDREVREELERTQAALKKEREAADQLGRTVAELERRQAELMKEREVTGQLSDAAAELEKRLRETEERERHLASLLAKRTAASWQPATDVTSRSDRLEAPEEVGKTGAWAIGVSGLVLLGLSISVGTAEGLCGGLMAVVMVLFFISHQLDWP